MTSKLTLKQINKKGKIELNWENIKLNGLLSQAKIDIAKHPAKNKVLIGAKSCGKTIIPLIEALIRFERDPFFNAFGFRKYKEQSAKALGDTFDQFLSWVEQNNFDIKRPYNHGQTDIQRVTYKGEKRKNQKFNFGSLENASGSSDGKTPTNGGYYGSIIIDEMLAEKDAGNSSKFVSLEEYMHDINIIRDNTERNNIPFSKIHNKEVQTTIWHLSNNWGEHGMINKMESILSEQEFINWVFGYNIEDLMENKSLLDDLFDNPKFIERLKSNNTLSKYVQEDDYLYCYMTKFANPNNCEEKQAKPLLKQIKHSLMTGDYNALTITMGLRHKGVIDKDMLVYHKDTINNISYSDAPTLISLGYRPESISFGVDIDTRKGAYITVTPTALFNKKSQSLEGNISNNYKILIDEQIEIPTYGGGEFGENNNIYTKLIIDTFNRYYLNFSKVYKFPNKVFVAFDENRKFIMNLFYNHKERPHWVTKIYQASKHGVYDIQNRQDATVKGIQSGLLLYNKRNQNLIGDMTVCVKRDINDPRRKTSGKTNYLDRIDSMEYGFQIFTPIIWRYK